jgi:PAS domain S-box-containing protein
MKLERPILLLTVAGLVILWFGDLLIHSLTGYSTARGAYWQNHALPLRVLGLAALLAAGLTASSLRARQLRAWQALKHRMETLEAVTSMATGLLHTQTWSAAAPGALEALARAAGVHGAVLCEYHRGEGGELRAELRHAWRRWGTEPAKARHPRIEGPLAAAHAAHCRGETLHGTAGALLASGCAVPESGDGENLAAAPVMTPDGCWGFVCFTRADPAPWTEEALATLDLAAQVLGAAIARQRSESGRADSQARLRAIVDNIPHLVWVKSVEGRYVAANRAFARACGKTVAALLGMTDRQLFPGLQADRMVEDDLRVMGLGQGRIIEEQAWGGAGAAWHETFKAPVRDRTGRVIGTAGFSQNVTERRRMEEELHRTEERHRALLSALSDIVLVVDGNGILVSVYASLPELAETQTRLLGRDIRDLLPPELAAQCLGVLDETRCSGLPHTFEICIPGQGESARHYEVRTAPAGQEQTLAVVRDMTALRLAERGLRRQSDRQKPGAGAAGFPRDMRA